MISLEDCVRMCGLTQKDVDAIAEQARVDQLTATALTDYLLDFEVGSFRARNTIRDDIRAALVRGDEARAHQLIMTLIHRVHPAR